MRSLELYSCLAERIGKFIEVRRLSGTDYASQTLLLEYFDRFLVEQQLSQPHLSREIVDRYQQTLTPLAPRTQSNRLCVVRQLCEYPARNDPLGYVPEPFRSIPSPQAHQPYIYSRKELQALLAATGKLAPPESLRPRTYNTLLGLLYSTGLRISEAFGLNLEDFHEPERRLYIAEGKFRKARWVSLSVSTAEALGGYIARRLKKSPCFDASPLFLNERRQRLCHPTVHAAFRRLLEACGIARDGLSGPRMA